MIGGDPQLATSAPGQATSGIRMSALAPGLSPATYLFGAAGLYSLLALAWSVAGREDLGNARAASLTAVIALAVTLAMIVANTGAADQRDGSYGRTLLGIGVALLTATEIAGFSVIWTENVMTWQPNAIVWLQAAGALGLVAGVFLLIGDAVRDRTRAAAAIGLVAFGTVLATPIVAGGRLSITGEPSSWSTIAPLLGVAYSSVAAAVAFDVWRTRDDDSDLSAAGLTLFALFVGIAIALQSLGSWNASSGLMALGRWVLPVAALGASASAITRSRPLDSIEHRWPGWSAASGRWPLIASALLAAAAIVALSLRASIGADLAAAATLCFVLLFGREALTLQLERSRAQTLEEATEELQRLANIDMLTGLPNRSALNARLAEEFERAFRYEQPMSLLFIDVDHFKRVNDSFGHAAGDSVLRQVAESLRFTARSIDFVGRYGGEEFLVIAPGTWTADAMILAERLRNHVQRVVVSTGTEETENITISVGIAGYPEHAADVPALLARADEALYQAKAAGRNQSVLFGSVGAN